TVEHRGPGGALIARVTKPELGLRQLVGIDRGDAIVEASADPLRSSVWRIPLAGGQPVQLSKEDGVVTAHFEHGVLVTATALTAGGKQFTITAGGQTHELPSVAEHPKLSPTTALETVQIEGRTHYVAITRPRDFDPQRKYPVLLKVYAGPH